MTTDETEPKAEPDTSRRRRPMRRIGLWVVLSFALVGAVLAFLAWSFIGRPVSAPEWLRAEIHNRLDQQFPGMEVRFSDVSFFVDTDLRPDITLSNVEVTDRQNNRVLFELARAELKIARRSLFEGQVLPRALSVSGVFLQLRRARDGSFDLALGGGLDGAQMDMAGVIAEMDRIALSPRLAALDRVEINAVTLDYQDARSGEAWVVDGGRLDLAREAQSLRLRGDFALLSGRSYAATLEVNAQSPIGSPELNFGVNVSDVASGDIASQSPALAWLGVLRAPISGALRASLDENGALGPLSATLEIGEGVVQPTDASRPIPFSSAKTYLTYDPTRTTLSFDEITVVSDWVRATGEGKARLEDLENGLPKALLGQLRLTGISANPDGIYATPRAIDHASVDFHLGLEPFVLRIGQLTLQDDSDPVHLSGRVTANRDGWGISVMAHMDEILPARLLGYWPDDLKPGTRRWIEDNVFDGVMRNVSVALTGAPGERPAFYLGAELDGAEVRFMRTMPHITGGKGVLQLENDRLVVSIDAGMVATEGRGNVDVAGSVFTIPDVRVREGPARVDLMASGPIPAALWLLNRDPLNAMDKAGRSVDLAEGRMRGRAQIDLFLKKKLTPDEVRYATTGTLIDVTSDQLVPDKTLQAAELSFAADNDSLKVFGPGALEGVPFDGSWQTALGEAARNGQGGRVEADVRISNEFLDAFDITLPPGSVNGAGTGKLALDLVKGQAPTFTLTSDLSGLGLRLDALGWSMGQGTTGRLEIDGTLSTPASIERLSLRAPGLSLEGTLSLRDGGGLDQLRIDRLIAGDWLDAPVLLTGRGEGTAPAVAITGGTIDLRRAPFSTTDSSAASDTGGGPLSLAPDRLQISDGIALTSFRGDFSTGGGLNGGFTARLNGGTELDGKVEPTRRGSRFVIRSSKAGGILRDAGLLKNVYGGRLTLRLNPTGAPGTFDGTLGIDKTSIRNASAMADLLSAISVVGLLEQLAGQGIGFSEVEAEFRLSPKQVILKRSSAVGPSLGISMDGYYDMESERMDMQGVVSPLYMVNFVGQLVSRRGEGLIGFNFTMRGKVDNPRIGVNPLSALTPGIFREIFRRPPPKVSQ